jgi:hypothetical protein
MKTSDLTLSIIIIFLFMLLYIFNILVVNYQRIKDNWPIYRCQPLIMPFASVFGHDSAENFSFCIQTMQKNMMGPLLKPLLFNVDMLGGITSGLTDNLNGARKFMKFLRGAMSGSFLNIFSTMMNMTVEMQRVFVNVKDMMSKVIGIMATTVNILNGTVMTMESAWAGPPGALVRALCFHPDTKLKLENGEIVSMKDIKLNSILQNKTRVCAVMQISNLDENGKIIEKMYKVDNEILVSGSHLIYNPTIKQFVHVKDLPESEISEINCDVLSCLITSDHTIPIGKWIFHDWEDSNGSAPKNIGNN